MIPFVTPEKTTPGIAVTAADCACTHLGSRLPFVQGMAGGRVNHTGSPVSILTAASPPAFSAPQLPSAFARYAKRPSVADPHSMPPPVLPKPTRWDHSTTPFLSGSSPQPIPDFWPITMMSLPFGSDRNIGD